jgi:formylglycine-generating enzyme required for sulfatase activity
MMKRLVVLFSVLVLLLAGCGSAEEPADTAQTTGKQATAEFKTPLPEAAEARVLPTNTPVPPPPTPTAQPTAAPTDTSVPEPTATLAQEATAASAEEATETPTEAPSPTVPPAPAVTDIMVEVPAGPFMMGNDEGDREDRPVHEVDLPAYEIDKFEVTNTDYSAFVQATGYQTDAEKQGKQSWRDAFKEGRESHPVVKVSWNDAVAYCEWAGKRLPTEAEWEKAARGTEALRFPWGNEWDPSKANVKETGLRSTAVVGSFGSGASPYGVEDMVGNAWEWTGDWYQAYPGNSAGDRYYGEQCRVTRGGGWFDDEPQATTFNRNCGVPDKTINDDLGFRCARSN